MCRARVVTSQSVGRVPPLGDEGPGEPSSGLVRATGVEAGMRSWPFSTSRHGRGRRRLSQEGCEHSTSSSQGPVCWGGLSRDHHATKHRIQQKVLSVALAKSLGTGLMSTECHQSPDLTRVNHSLRKSVSPWFSRQSESAVFNCFLPRIPPRKNQTASIVARITSSTGTRAVSEAGAVSRSFLRQNICSL